MAFEVQGNEKRIGIRVNRGLDKSMLNRVTDVEQSSRDLQAPMKSKFSDINNSIYRA
jgi:hypothetical protein